MFRIKQSGNFNKTERFLNSAKQMKVRSILDRFGRQGVSLLSSATPVDTGLTAQSWDYGIKVTRGGFTIEWTNSNVVDGIPIAILLQYGHGTGTGGWVQGRDYINPAIKSVFNDLVENLWKEVSSL